MITEVDATAFTEARSQLKEIVTVEWGYSPGYNDLLAIIVARALREYLYIDACVKEDNSTVDWLGKVNMGMAVKNDRGLQVPVICDADKKGLRE